jgi:predicted nucleic acid-binding protein
VIVVDTNVLAYAVIPGVHTADALALVERDPAWVAPRLWRYELRNVLATMMRVQGLSFAQGVAAFRAAERLVADAAVDSTLERCLRLAARGRVSAWDAEFVLTAEGLGLPLVTADKRLARAFPRRAVLLEDVAAG